MFVCRGTHQHNPLTDMIFNVMSAMGFEVKQYDPAFPLIEEGDWLHDYLGRINSDLWDIADGSDLRVGDTAIFAHEHGTSGKLLNESGINVGPVINSDMQIPLMRGMKSLSLIHI